ncbi:MAG: hypothetical protein ACRYF0_00255 [Janthinobacterium lividum]
MKVLLCFGSWLGTTIIAHAQLLPVPNARNPDWVLDKVTLNSRSSQPDTLPGNRDRMPIASPNPQGKALAMPNALTTSISGKSVSIVGGQQYYWDAAQQLRYEWSARHGQGVPDSLVIVHQQITGATFTYHKRFKLVQGYSKEPRLLRSPAK